jgi:hypothetical protein
MTYWSPPPAPLGPPGHIPGFHLPGTLMPIAAAAAEDAKRAAAADEANRTAAQAETDRNHRRDHLLLLRR